MSSSPRKQVRSGRTSSTRIPMRKSDNSKNNSNNNNAVLEETPKQSRIPRRSDQSTDSGNVQPLATAKSTSASKIRKLEPPKSSKLRAPSQSFVTSTPKSSQGTKGISITTSTTITTNISVTTSATPSSKIPKLRSSGSSGTSVSSSGKVNSSINNGKHKGKGRVNGNVSGANGVKRGPSQSPELALPVQTIAALYSDLEDGAISPLPSCNTGEFPEVDLQTVGSVTPDSCIGVTESIAVSFDEVFVDADGDTHHDVGMFAVTTGKLVTQGVFDGAEEPMSPILHSEAPLQEPTGESGFYESLEQVSDLQGSLSVGLQDRSEYDERVWASDDEHDYHPRDGGEEAKGLIFVADRAVSISKTGFPETAAMVCDVVGDELHDVIQNDTHDSAKLALQDFVEPQETVLNVQQVHDDTESDDDTIKLDDQESGLSLVTEPSPVLTGQSAADTEVDIAKTEGTSQTVVDISLQQQAVSRSVDKGHEQEVAAQESMDTMSTECSDSIDEGLVELPCHESDNLLVKETDDGPIVQQTLEVHAMPVVDVSISETIAVDSQTKVVTMDTTCNEDGVSKQFTEPQEEVMIVQQTSDSSEDAAVSDFCDLIHQEDVASVVVNSLSHTNEVGDQETTETVEVLTATNDVLETRRAESLEPRLQELVEPRHTDRSVSRTMDLAHELEPAEPNGTHSKSGPELDRQDTALMYDLEDTVHSTYTPEIGKNDYELDQSLTSAQLASNYSKDAATSAVILTESANSGAILTESANSAAILTESANSGAILTEYATSGAILTEAATSGAILTEAATSGPILTEAATSGPILTEAATSGPILTEAATSGPILTESATSGPILTESATSGPILTESATSGPILTESATSGPILTESATSGQILTESATSGPILTEFDGLESQEEDDGLSLAIRISGTNDANELNESPMISQIVSHASVNRTDKSVKSLQPETEPVSLTESLSSTKTYRAEPTEVTVKVGQKLDSEQISSFTNSEPTSGSAADENSNKSTHSSSAFQIILNSVVPEEEKEVEVAKIINKVNSSKDDTGDNCTKNFLPSALSNVQVDEPLTSFSILQSFAKNGIAAERENRACTVESIKDSVDSGTGIKSFARTSDQHSGHLENLAKPRSGTPDSCSENGSQNNRAVEASTGIATDDKKEDNIQRLDSEYVIRQTPVWRQSTVTSTTSPVYGTVLKTTTLSAKTEKILASSNMLKACIGQAALPKRFRSLSGMMSTASEASSATSRNDRDYEDSASQPTPPEDVYDLETLEKMLEAASNYDQRRRIRAQMRIVKKNQGPGEEKSSMMLIDLKNGNNSVNQSYNGQLGRNSAASLSVMSTTATRSVNYNYDNLIGNGVAKTTEQVWQSIDSMVADSLNTDFDNGPGTDTIPPLLPPSHPRSSLLDDFDSRPTNKMGDTMWVQGVNLLEVNDELKLHELLDRAEDYEDRKIIRARLKDVIAENRVKREEFIRRREEEREEFLRARVRDADEQKRRTLAMYDAMAKSAPAGGNKTLDVSILRGEGSGRSTPTLTNSPGAKVDLVEQAIRQRQKEADDRKKKVLAAYDQAARSGPAGSARFVDFDAVRDKDVQIYENSPRFTSTFQMKGGIPIAGPVKVHNAPLPAAEQPRDSMEEAIRRRQREADERKRRTLEAYDKAAKSRPAGTPVNVYIPYDDSIEPVVELAKGTKPLSPRERFQKMDSDVAPKGTNTPVAKPANAGLVRSPTAIKEMLLNWVKSKTKEYDNVPIENFSTSWNDGMAFCALIHHFYPDAFDFSTLNPKNRRANFELAFKVAEEKADISPLLDVEDMVIMKKPDWKCVFTYVQSIYRRLHNAE